MLIKASYSGVENGWMDVPERLSRQTTSELVFLVVTNWNDKSSQQLTNNQPHVVFLVSKLSVQQI